MTQYATSWNLSRQRFVDEIKELNDEQLNWKPYPGALSIGQMALHVCGVEISFSSQILGATLCPEDLRIKTAATEGVVNDNPFPFSDQEITADLVAATLAQAKAMVEPVITEPTTEMLAVQLKSALGPIISGDGALARFAFHPAYHQGQSYTYKGMPGFPKA